LSICWGYFYLHRYRGSLIVQPVAIRCNRDGHDQLADFRRRFDFLAWMQVTVYIYGDGCACMPQAYRNHHWRVTVIQQQRGGGVAKIVEPDRRNHLRIQLCRSWFA